MPYSSEGERDPDFVGISRDFAICFSTARTSLCQHLSKNQGCTPQSILLRTATILMDTGRELMKWGTVLEKRVCVRKPSQTFFSHH